jgi:hypothetical protein
MAVFANARMGMLAGLLLSGCGGGAEIRGTVTTMPGVGADGRYVPARAIPRALIEVSCRSGAPPSLVVRADEHGFFAKDLDDDLDSHCRIRASSPGYAPRVIRVLDACAAGRVHECSGVSVSARLLPEVRQ